MQTEQTRLDFPFPVEKPAEPASEFGMLREHRPVCPVRLPSGDNAWLVTRHEDVWQVLADPRLSRAAATRPDAPRLGPARPEPTSIMSMDRPAHTRLRRLVGPAFSTARCEALRPWIQRTCDFMLDNFANSGPPADLVQHVGNPLPITVICELLGVPDEDRDTFRTWTDASLSLFAKGRDAVLEARSKINDYLSGLVDAKRRTPDDSLMSALIAATDAGDRLSEPELIMLAATVLTAGYQTVSTAIANCTLSLLRNRSQLSLLIRRPALVPAAVEELLRYTPGPVSGGTIRIATEDFELGGQMIGAGEAVIPATTSANRDMRVFPAPDNLDLTRANNPHVAFGHGPHYCLGASLARLELQVVLGTLLRRFPGIELAVPLEELRWNTQTMIRSLEHLPLRW